MRRQGASDDRLAQLGGRLIDSTAKALAAILRQIAAVVGGDAEPVGVGSPSQSAETLVPPWAIINAVVLFATLLLVLLRGGTGDGRGAEMPTRDQPARTVQRVP
jgi:hypothetical protein